MLLSIMADYNGPLEAVDCNSHSVRNNMVLESSVGGHLRCLIRPPTTHSVRYDMAVNRGAGGHLRCLIRPPTTL
eukprot:scaffold19416_cov106-Skeletonema_marinoi.AAC.1